MIDFVFVCMAVVNGDRVGKNDVCAFESFFERRGIVNVCLNDLDTLLCEYLCAVLAWIASRSPNFVFFAQLRICKNRVDNGAALLPSGAKYDKELGHLLRIEVKSCEYGIDQEDRVYMMKVSKVTKRAAQGKALTFRITPRLSRCRHKMSVLGCWSNRRFMISELRSVRQLGSRTSDDPSIHSHVAGVGHRKRDML